MNGVKKLSSGKVFLVGAGPGDPGLFTLKGLRILKKADIVIYDRLVHDQIVKLIPKKVRKVCLGKAFGQADEIQRKISELMVSEAKAGRNVVRLKGGDPFVFGRGGEEAQYLKRFDVKFEVVPGVTSAFAAPAYAGIPVSHRDFSSSVVLVTGTEGGGGISKVDWGKVGTSIDTVVVLMGIRQLNHIVSSMLDSGRSQKTDVAIIEWGTTEKQRTIYGILGNIVEKARKSRLESPAVIVIGDVVKLREELQWFREKRH
jgi:uroporphyrinogen III methyltransferase/synthase